MANSTTPSFLTVSETPSKGHAVFAKQAISKGTLLLSESPVLTISDEPTAIQDLLADFQVLSSDTKKLILDLDEHASSEFKEYVAKQLVCKSWDSRKITPWMQRVVGVFEHNALGPNLCLKGAMFSHSCSPNAHTTWNPSMGEQIFYATRDIAAGEEVCISHLSGDAIFLPKNDRQRLLQNRGFTCRCDACLAAEQDERHGVKNPSEELRRQWSQLVEKYTRNESRLLKNFSSGDHLGVDHGFARFLWDVAVGIVEVQEKLGIYDLELKGWYQKVVGWSLHLGDEEMVRKWRQKVLEYVRVCVGEGHEVYQTIRRELDN